MGEAKRRKKLMGKDYGKKRQRIVKGTHELDAHLDKLDNEFLKKMTEVLGMPPDLDIPLPEFQSRKNLCQQWLKDYLETYPSEIQKKLAESFLDIHYESFYRRYEKIKEESQEIELRQELIAQSIPLMFYYSCYQDYLETQLREFYLEPLEAINERVWEQMLANQKEIEEAETENASGIIRYLIKDVLKESNKSPLASDKNKPNKSP